MSGGPRGVGIPKIIIDADALLTKLAAYRDRWKLKGPERELVNETLEVISGLKDHSKAEYERGVRVGKDSVWRSIRAKMEPDPEPFDYQKFTRGRDQG